MLNSAKVTNFFTQALERLLFMILTEKIKLLCDEEGITFAELERRTGISNGQIRRWDSSSPKTENIEKVADYFGVRIDYLLGRTDDKYLELIKRDENEEQIISLFRKYTAGMTEEEKGRFNRSLDKLISAAKGIL